MRSRRSRQRTGCRRNKTGKKSAARSLVARKLVEPQNAHLIDRRDSKSDRNEWCPLVVQAVEFQLPKQMQLAPALGKPKHLKMELLRILYHEAQEIKPFGTNLIASIISGCQSLLPRMGGVAGSANCRSPSTPWIRRGMHTPSRRHGSHWHPGRCVGEAFDGALGQGRFWHFSG